ncbi:MAG: TRAP transporter small permease [Betaproteobacteria bacterium]
MLSSVASRLNSGIDALAVATFTGMFLCVIVQVVLRYGFDRPLVWSDELGRYLFVWCAFLGWIVAARRRAHLSITLVSDKLGPRGQAMFALTGAVTTIVFCAILAWYGLQITWRNADIDTVALFFTFGVVYAIVPVAAVAVGLAALVDALAALRRWGSAEGGAA